MSQTVQDRTAGPLPAELHAALVSLVEKKAIELPVLPEVASQVITASMDEECDLRHLTTLISRDQSMTAHLLRLANCALYAPAVPILSLQQALNRLGLKKIRELALIASCESKVFRVAGFDLAVRGLFKHSLAAAAYAQEIARKRGDAVDEAFLCGLLHDVGRPVLLQAISDLKGEMGVEVERQSVLAAAAEFHCRVGSDLVQSWGLPERLAGAILHHHAPAQGEGARSAAMLTRLADDLAHYVAGPKDVTAEALRAHELLAPLALDGQEMERLLALKDTVLQIVESAA
ncbi:MAG: HDOD domain-containing protein [Planctomycetes bacterium]|nr:HDOD domain-containing protein [Planctomycetota bacterium]